MLVSLLGESMTRALSPPNRIPTRRVPTRRAPTRRMPTRNTPQTSENLGKITTTSENRQTPGVGRVKQQVHNQARPAV